MTGSHFRIAEMREAFGMDSDEVPATDDAGERPVPLVSAPDTADVDLAIAVTTSGESSTDPVVCIIDFGATKTSTNGPLQVTPDAHAGWGAA